MKHKQAKLYTTIVTAVLLSLTSAGLMAQSAFSGDQIKIGVLGDMSGVYAAGYSGKGSIAAAKMAVEDFGGSIDGHPIKVISADHQNKPDVGSAIARKWIDTKGVDMLVDLTNSAVAIAVQKVASSKGVISINTGSATDALTNADCTKYGIDYGYNTHGLAVGTATGVVKNGGKKWFFITADYAFGHSLQKNTSQVVEAMGGQVVGSVNAPLGTNDFSSYLIQAQNSGAQVVALANAGRDAVNSAKQAGQFGIVKSGQKLVGMLFTLNTIQSLGLESTQGLQFTGAWYWNQDEASRKWTKRYLEYSDGQAPTFMHAAVYSATTAYLNAVKAAGTDDGAAVRAQMGKEKINDFFVQNGSIRQDGLLMDTLHLLKVKSPSESKSKWDLATVVSDIPASKAYRTLEQTACPLVH